MAKVLGIDLGTTNSCMAIMEGGEPLVLENVPDFSLAFGKLTAAAVRLQSSPTGGKHLRALAYEQNSDLGTLMH